MLSPSSIPATSGKKLVQEALLYALAKGIPGSLGLLAVIVFIRLVGSEQFGIYAIVFATVSMWSSFASGWYYQGILRYYSAWRTTPAAMRRFLLLGVGVSAGVYTLAFTGNTVWLDTHLALRDAAAGLGLGVLIIVQTVALSCWQSNLQPNVVLRVEMIRSVATFVFSCALAYFVAARSYSLLAGAGLGYALSLFGGKLPVPSTGGVEPTAPSLRQAWRYGWPLSFWFLVQLSFPWLDRVMIESQFGLRTTGMFASLSEVLTRGFSLLVYPLTIAAYPRLTALWNAGEHAASRRLLRLALSLGVAISVVAVILVHGTQAQWLPWLLPGEGPALAHNEPMLVGAVTMGGAIWQLALLAHKPLELQSRTAWMLGAIVAALAVKVAANQFGLAHWGLSGVAYGTIASGILYAGLCLMAARATRPT